MKFQKSLLACLLSVSFANSLSAESDKNTPALLKDSQAESFANLLERAGVKAESHRVSIYKVDALRCQWYEFSEIPNCSFEQKGEVSIISEAVSTELFNILAQHGASIPSEFGVLRVLAKNVSCFMQGLGGENICSFDKLD